MGKLGQYDYPDLSFTLALQSVKELDSKLKGDEMTLEGMSSALGHGTHKSGGFLMKIADLRRFGLLSGRGKMTLSDLAKRILYPTNPEEERAALTEAFMSVQLFKEIYNRFGATEPSESDINTFLLNFTKQDRGIIAKKAVNIRKSYIEGMSRIGNMANTPGQVIPASRSFSPSAIPGRTVSGNPNVFEKSFGDIFISIPKTKAALEELNALYPIIKKQIEREVSEATEKKEN
ncbi:MAG: hypothetical protein V1820_01875 [archaeon]